MLVTVNRFLSKQIAKRARNKAKFSIDMVAEEGAEAFVLPELAHGDTAEDDFNRRWALSLIESEIIGFKETIAAHTYHLIARIISIEKSLCISTILLHPIQII